MNSLQKNYNKSFIATCVTAVIAAVTSTLCCIAPLIYLMFGVSSTWLVSLNDCQFSPFYAILYGIFLNKFSPQIAVKIIR